MHPAQAASQQMPQLTREDLRKIQKSMRKPEFMGLLNEYMIEVSDPKNKKEYDDWLRQMQNENQLPKHMKLIQPVAEFCVKTNLTSIKNKQHEMKFFINMCSASQIEKPSFEPFANDKGEIGQNWKVPNSMGKIRYDQDKKGDVCNTVDAVFNPYTFALAQNKSFQSMIINIALDTAQKQLGQRKETLSKDYVVLQNLKCKGGEPALLPVRSIEGRLMNKGEGEVERDLEGRETNLQKEINQKKEQHEKDEQKKLKEKEQAEMEKKKLDQELKEQSNLNANDDSKGPARPKFQAIYSYAVDYADFIDTKVDKKRKIPSTYAIEFKLPKVENFSEIKVLDVNESKLVLDAGDKYFIDLEFTELKLSFKLLTAESKAKFDKKKRTLRVTFPIDKSSIPKEPVEQDKPNDQQKDETEEPNNTVQDQTWKDKNKLLEITENKISTQFIQPEPQSKQPPKKKFVEEIDEDDNEDNRQNKQSSKTESSSIKQPTPPPVIASTKPITYKFQETPQNCFVIVNLPKYRKEDVEVVVHEQKILVRWAKPAAAVEYFALKINRSEFSKFEVRLIVEYAVVKLDKTVNGFWEASSITTIEDLTPEAIQSELQTIKADHQKKIEDNLQKKLQAEKDQTSVVPVTTTEKQAEVSELKQPIVGEVSQTKVNFVDHKLEEASRLKTKNIQFIRFNIGLVERLD